MNSALTHCSSVRVVCGWTAILFACGILPLALFAADKTLTGDRLPTADGDLIVHPVNHASLVLGWKTEVIYVDPVGGPGRYAELPAATVVLITHPHGDHFDLPTLKAVAGDGADLIVSPGVAERLPSALRARSKALANGEKVTVRALTCEALPAYNLTAERLNFHPKGRDNGYLLTAGGKRIYLSGDTEDIPEMRALKDIAVAFLCMNLPYTMDVDKAADATRAFKPTVVYPYHSRGSDLDKFQRLVGADAGVEVRLRDWYAK